ncbi:hypothetical protein [Bacillus glycinifermentans]|uniref:hypothetical protein n=1 Tax=Bacillus glycinifermentans TaxID=1664069 RepID=UPI0022E49765|nr:hypothetical protein [Bacillus glycinifermentans]
MSTILKIDEMTLTEKNIKSLLLGKRNFYNVVATYGYEFKRGKGNKLFVKGEENAPKTNL